MLVADALRQWFSIKKIGKQLLMVVAGCMIFQAVLAFTISIGVDPNFLKLITALFVLLFVALPRITVLIKPKNN